VQQQQTHPATKTAAAVPNGRDKGRRYDVPLDPFVSSFTFNYNVLYTLQHDSSCTSSLVHPVIDLIDIESSSIADRYLRKTIPCILYEGDKKLPLFLLKPLIHAWQ